jgi:hypothetical protein
LRFSSDFLNGETHSEYAGDPDPSPYPGFRPFNIDHILSYFKPQPALTGFRPDPDNSSDLIFGFAANIFDLHFATSIAVSIAASIAVSIAVWRKKSTVLCID